MSQEKTEVLFQIEALKENASNWKGPFSVVLVTRDGKEPWIRVISADGYRMNEFAFASMFRLELSAHEVFQYHGDGPETSTVSKQTVWRAITEAMRRLTHKDGRLEVVWVPNDPRVPF